MVHLLAPRYHKAITSITFCIPGACPTIFAYYYVPFGLKENKFVLSMIHSVHTTLSREKKIMISFVKIVDFVHLCL